MSKTDKIKLNGNEYTIHPFNIGEMERVTDAFQGPPNRVAFTILRIALERAEPKVPDINGLEASLDEIRSASEVIMRLAGMEANPPVPAAPAAA